MEMLSKWQLTSRMHAQQFTNGADHTAVVCKSRIRNDINLHGSVVPQRERGTDRQEDRKADKQTGRQTERQRQTETGRDRQRKKETDRQRKKETDRQTETDTERDYGGRWGADWRGRGGDREVFSEARWPVQVIFGRRTRKNFKPKRSVLPVQRVCCTCFVVAHICCHVRTRSRGFFSS